MADPRLHDRRRRRHAVDRLDQTYQRIPGQAAGQSYDYAAPAFDFRCRLTYDQSGLVLDYPGIAVRTA